jgi:hypothetical protein
MNVYIPKVGHKVEVNHPNAGFRAPPVGKVAAINETPRGPWVEVNLGDKKNPLLKRFRPAHLVRMR